MMSFRYSSYKYLRFFAAESICLYLMFDNTSHQRVVKALILC
jgi:hypothetical protein